jgi:valyl-tRNA synthetase
MVGGTTKLSFVPVISTVYFCYSFDNGVLLFMKYNNKEIEERWKREWSDNKTYTFEYDENKPTYVVDTPPPYVSADHLHVGHIMSYTQAEFIVRYKRMCGYNVFYPMGFDDNGLPTERFVEKKYKVDKSKISRSDFIDICLEETQLGSETYKQLWTDLGISVDWTKTYSTISPIAMKTSQWSLIDLYKKDLLYRAEKPILWCTVCKTALAQADLEDEEQDSKMNYISFGSHEGNDLIIATTRPELLPGCVSLYVNPEDTRYSSLIDQKVKVPIFDYEVPVKASPSVDSELGTGLMMVCTWGDQEDLEKWQIDGLNTRTLVTEDGLLNELGQEFEGLTLSEARKAILSKLASENLLLKQEEITHTVKVHERCDTPIEFVQSKQWFIKIADNKEEWLEYGEKLNWYPPERKADYDLWVKSLKWDWCVSRQRYYGVPLPIWYCNDCDEPIFATEDSLPVNPIEDKAPVSKCNACSSENIVSRARCNGYVGDFIVHTLYAERASG